jgi:hypothetical protein
MLMSNAEILSLMTAVVAISASSLGTGEALIVLTLLSLGVWRRLYSAAYWLAAALTSRQEPVTVAPGELGTNISDHVQSRAAGRDKE